MTNPAILIVDDEVNIRSALMRWFQIRGFDVYTAVDGLDAVSMCSTRRYSAITMDLDMPRMGGADAVRAIREFDPDVPILIVTGLPRDTDMALSGGATKVLMKPIRLSVLEEEVRGAMLPVEAD